MTYCYWGYVKEYNAGFDIQSGKPSKAKFGIFPKWGGFKPFQKNLEKIQTLSVFDQNRELWGGGGWPW